MRTEEEIKAIQQKFLERRCSPEELQELLTHYKEMGTASSLMERLYQELQQEGPVDAALQEKIDRVIAGMDNFLSVRKRGRIPKPWIVGLAAGLMLALAIGLYFYMGRKQSVPMMLATDVGPGGNKAIITLADGRRMDLSNNQQGIVVSEGKLSYADGSDLMSQQQDTNAINTLVTPRGGQYQVVLGDGTKVWLNAASTLRYPVRFSGDTRSVELEGEGYFEVNTNDGMARRRKPFVVKSAGQEIRVLGTSFNVSSYRDEKQIITTLVSGKVRVTTVGTGAKASHNMGIELLPGKQAVSSDTDLQVRDADPQSAIAWKGGNFYFKGAPLEELMRQVARWYDIDVVYKGAAPHETFSGKLSRNVNLAKVIDFLEGSGIHCRTDGRKLVIEGAD